MTQRCNRVEGDWDGSVLTGPVPLVFQASTLLPPTYPVFATPFARFIARKREQKPGRRGLRREGQSTPPIAKTQGAWEWGEALVPSPSPLETRIAEVGPHKSEIDYCFYSPGAAGDRDPTFTIEL